MNNNANYPYVGQDEKIEIIDEHRSIIISTLGLYIVYYYDRKVHREDGWAWQIKTGDKFYYWMNEKIKCSSDEEWKQLVALRAFW